jgi:hypothetical protein
MSVAFDAVEPNLSPFSVHSNPSPARAADDAATLKIATTRQETARDTRETVGSARPPRSIFKSFLGEIGRLAAG